MGSEDVIDVSDDVWSTLSGHGDWGSCGDICSIQSVRLDSLILRETLFG